MQFQPETIGPIAAFLSSCTWAVGTSVYSKLARGYSAPLINTSRAVIALPLFFVTALLLSPEQFSMQTLSSPGMVWCFVSTIASYALGDILFFMSTIFLGVPGALAIASIYPLWSAMSGALFLGEALSAMRLLGVFVIISGTILVILSGRQGRSAEQPHVRNNHVFYGAGLALLTSFFWALNTYAVAEAGRSLSMPMVNVIRMAGALVFCPLVGRLVAPLTRQKLDRFILPSKAFWPSVWVFALEGFGGSAFFAYGLAHSPLAIGSALTSLAPVLAVPIGFILGIEKPTVLRTLAVGMVVTGLFLL